MTKIILVREIANDIDQLPLEKLPTLDDDLKNNLNEVAKIFNRIPEEIENLDISGILSD